MGGISPSMPSSGTELTVQLNLWLQKNAVNVILMCYLGAHQLLSNHLRAAPVKSSLTSECTDVSIMDLHDKVGYSRIPSNFKSDIWRQKRTFFFFFLRRLSRYQQLLNDLPEKAAEEHISLGCSLLKKLFHLEWSVRCGLQPSSQLSSKSRPQ